MAIDSRVALIMAKDVKTVGPETPVEEVAKLLWENKISSLPVVEERKVIGMVTDFDLITRETEYDAPMYISLLEAYFHIPGTGDAKQLKKILAISARDLMTSPAITVTPEMTVLEVATLMYDKRLNALPVTDLEGNLIGIVARADIVRLMVADEDLHERTHPEED
ncbi:MAG TPA: CBS domain-containing protein [Nitrolancea sp.]|nr:CBS domain-containing protein [Nitrolancea sp.]